MVLLRERGGSRSGALRCAWCHDDLAQAVTCAACHAVHHADCWTDAAGCATCRHERTAPRVVVAERAPAVKSQEAWSSGELWASFLLSLSIALAPFLRPKVAGAWDLAGYGLLAVMVLPFVASACLGAVELFRFYAHPRARGSSASWDSNTPRSCSPSPVGR